MAVADETSDAQWLAVIGRSLAFLCLSSADLRDKDLVSQALFLEKLGLRRAESASLLGTTTDSLGVMERRLRKKKSKGGARGKKAK